jgi:3-hydroxyacyl-[acyl-carrier-protein] dehydratase
MLYNSFFTIEQQEIIEGKNLVKVLINENHDVFNGHFPDNPVVPGVFLIQMVKEIIELNERQKFQLKKSDEIKFVNMVVPTIFKNLTVEITNKSSEERAYAYSILVKNEEYTFIKMKLDLLPE